LADRDRILGAAKLSRHDRILISNGGDGLLLWESLRRAPEGLSACLVESESARETLIRYAATLDEEEQPRIAVFPPARLPGKEEAAAQFDSHVFDHILAREPWRRPPKSGGTPLAPEESFSHFAAASYELLASGGSAVILQSPPRLGERISRLIAEASANTDTAAPKKTLEKLRKAEDAFFGEEAFFSWDAAALERAFQEAGFETQGEIVEQKEERLITAGDLGLWFDKEHSRWGGFMNAKIGDKDFAAVETLMRELTGEGPVVWKWKSILLTATKK
jgi:putative ATPase